MTLGNHPLSQLHHRELWDHPMASAISLPPSPSPPEPTPAAAGRAERGGQVTRMLWSTLDQQCPVPRERSEQGDAIPYLWGDKQLSVRAGILHGQTFHGQPAAGSNPAAPCRVPAWHGDPACSLTGRGIVVREGKTETSRNGPETSRNSPERSLCFPTPQSPTCPLQDPAPASRPVPNPRVRLLGLLV